MAVACPECGASFGVADPRTYLHSLPPAWYAWAMPICLAVQIPPFLFALYIAWGLDIWAGISLFYPSYVIGVSLVLVLLLLPFVAYRRAPIMVIPALWLMFSVSLPFVNNSSIKPLLRGMNDLDIGMTKEDVLKTLESHYARSPYPMPVIQGETESRLDFWPRGRDSAFAAESLLVHMQDGRVIGTMFSAD